MDRNQAAINPAAADKHVAEKLSERLLEPDPVAEEEIVMNKPRAAFLGMALELKVEVVKENEKNSRRGKQLWESF